MSPDFIAALRRATEPDYVPFEADHAFRAVTDVLAASEAVRDPGTRAHSRRLGKYIAHLAGALGMDASIAKRMQLAAGLHDIGKLGVPEEVLNKTGALSHEELVLVRGHTVIGHKILSQRSGKLFELAATMALHHHERWDGSGYPNGIRGAEIPVEAQLIPICDVYDAVRSARPYKRPRTHDEAVDIILNGDGRTEPNHFAPMVVDVFRNNLAELDRIFEADQRQRRHEPTACSPVRSIHDTLVFGSDAAE